MSDTHFLIEHQVVTSSWLLTMTSSASGNANLTEPQGGWTSTALQNIFSQRPLWARPSRTPASAQAALAPDKPLSTTALPSAASPFASNSTLRKSSKKTTKRVTGGVLGGIAGSLVVVTLIYFLGRRRRAMNG